MWCSWWFLLPRMSPENHLMFPTSALFYFLLQTWLILESSLNNRTRKCTLRSSLFQLLIPTSSFLSAQIPGRTQMHMGILTINAVQTPEMMTGSGERVFLLFMDLYITFFLFIAEVFKYQFCHLTFCMASLLKQKNVMERDTVCDPWE